MTTIQRLALGVRAVLVQRHGSVLDIEAEVEAPSAPGGIAHVCESVPVVRRRVATAAVERACARIAERIRNGEYGP